MMPMDRFIWRDCAHNAWAKVHLPEIYAAGALSAFDLALMETGNEVDQLARSLFPGGCLIARDDAAATTKLIEAREAILYQPVFETDQYTTACDILVWNADTGGYDLFEVKASTTGGDSRARHITVPAFWATEIFGSREPRDHRISVSLYHPANHAPAKPANTRAFADDSA